MVFTQISIQSGPTSASIKTKTATKKRELEEGEGDRKFSKTVEILRPQNLKMENY